MGVVVNDLHLLETCQLQLSQNFYGETFGTGDNEKLDVVQQWQTVRIL